MCVCHRDEDELIIVMNKVGYYLLHYQSHLVWVSVIVIKSIIAIKS